MLNYCHLNCCYQQYCCYDCCFHLLLYLRRLEYSWLHHQSSDCCQRYAGWDQTQPPIYKPLNCNWWYCQMHATYLVESILYLFPKKSSACTSIDCIPTLHNSFQQSVPPFDIIPLSYQRISTVQLSRWASADWYMVQFVAMKRRNFLYVIPAKTILRDLSP